MYSMLHIEVHLVLSVNCFPSDCLLSPLMSPEDKKCN